MTCKNINKCRAIDMSAIPAFFRICYKVSKNVENFQRFWFEMKISAAFPLRKVLNKPKQKLAIFYGKQTNYKILLIFFKSITNFWNFEGLSAKIGQKLEKIEKNENQGKIYKVMKKASFFGNFRLFRKFCIFSLIFIFFYFWSFCSILALNPSKFQTLIILLDKNQKKIVVCLFPMKNC